MERSLFSYLNINQRTRSVSTRFARLRVAVPESIYTHFYSYFHRFVLIGLSTPGSWFLETNVRHLDLFDDDRFGDGERTEDGKAS